MEIARNSIMQSGFEEEFKEKYLGKDFRRGVTFCDERLTHVPLIRAKFRAGEFFFWSQPCFCLSFKSMDTYNSPLDIFTSISHRDF
jgi:adenosine deaminase